MADAPLKRPRGPTVRATVVTSDLAGTTSLYRRALGWRQYTDVDHLDETIARRWGAQAVADAPRILLGPGHGPTVAFVEEVMVTDAASAVDAAEQAGFTVLARPRRLGAGGASPLVAGQVAGPAGEGLHLTQFWTSHRSNGHKQVLRALCYRP